MVAIVIMKENDIECIFREKLQIVNESYEMLYQVKLLSEDLHLGVNREIVWAEKNHL